MARSYKSPENQDSEQTRPRYSDKAEPHPGSLHFTTLNLYIFQLLKIFQVKKKLSVLCLTKHYAMRTYGGCGCIDPRFLDFDTSCMWASRPGRFIPRERVPSTHWLGAWEGPGAGMNDDMEKWTFFILPELELRPLSRPARSQSLYRLSYYGS
jgi:hypothetical protein